MLRASALLMLTAAWAASQSRLEAPRVGFLRDSENRLRPLYGLAGNFVPGEPVAAGVLWWAGSARWTFVKFDREVVLLDADGLGRARWEAPPGEALFAFTDAGEPALVYFRQTGELCGIEGQALVALGVIGGSPVAVGSLDNERAVLVVASERGLLRQTVRLASGHIEQESVLAPEAGPAVLLPGSLAVYARDFDLCVQGPEGGERCVALPAPVEALGQLNERWVEIRLRGAQGRLALRVDEESLALYRLPEIGQ